MTSLEATAKDWLLDPPWNKLFKNSFDVIEDQVNKGLLALATIGLAVRFLANLPSGDLLCIVIGVNGTYLDLKTMAGPAHASMAAYAAQDSECHKAVFNSSQHAHAGSAAFIQYSPIILMIQVILLIATEKIWMIFPRLSQKLERFYKAVVEEALLGKDPDVAEDFAGGKVNIDSVVRERQREEITGALRGSNLFYNLYVVKNLAEIGLAQAFLVVDAWWGLPPEDKAGYCFIPLKNLGEVEMQCRQKRFDFYRAILIAFISLLVLHILTSLVSLIWSIKLTKLRRITSIISSLREGNEGGGVVESAGEDFLFLFDLVAHSCGQPATLRVLSYTAPTFYELCKPELQEVTMTESSIRLTWNPCKLQSMEVSNQLEVQKYVVTIFPTVKHVSYEMSAEDNQHEYEFKDLAGGKSEYIVTVSTIIGDAKMRGVTTTRYLPPFPPQNLDCRELDNDNRARGSRIKVRWSRPKGAFDKYILKVVCPGEQQKTESVPDGRPVKLPSYFPHTRNNRLSSTSFSMKKREREPGEVWLGEDETEYVWGNLRPGERYQLQLCSMTGSQTCLEDKILKQDILTKPLPPSLEAITITAHSDRLHINIEKAMAEDRMQEGGQDLHFGYKIKVMVHKEGDKKLQWDNIMPKHQRSLTVDNIIISTTQYTVSIASISRTSGPMLNKGDLMGHGPLESLSNFVDKTVTTPPLVPVNLRQDQYQVGSLKVKWDSPSSLPQTGKLSFNVSIHPLSSDVKALVKEDWKEVDSNVYQFSQLPEVVGTGEKYRVSVLSVYTSPTGQVTRSQPTTEICFTKPLPPRELKVLDDDKQIISWQRSQSPSVRMYKVKIRKENEKAQDFIHEVDERQSDCQFQIPELDLLVEYKLNIYSVLMHGEQQVVESEPLFYKIKKEDFCSLNAEIGPRDLTDCVRKFKLVLIGREKERDSSQVGSGLISRQTSVVGGDVAV